MSTSKCAFAFHQAKDLLIALNGRVIGKEEQTQKDIFFYLWGVGSLPRWQQWPMLGPAKRRSLEFQPVNRGWDVWTIFCCFPRCINKELNQKQSIKDRHSYSLPSWPATHSQSHFLQCGQRSLAEANDVSSFKAQVAAGVKGQVSWHRGHDGLHSTRGTWSTLTFSGRSVMTNWFLCDCSLLFGQMFKTAMRHLIISQRPKTF